MNTRTYDIADAQVDDLIGAIRRRFDVRSDEIVERRVIHYDTFDWRVYANGASLWTVQNGDGILLTLDTGSEELSARVDEPPGFMADMAPARIRKALERPVKMRRLLPMVEVASVVEVLNIQDSRSKTVARVAVERPTATSGDGSRIEPMAPVLVASPVKGYDREFALLRVLIEEDLGLGVVAEDERQRATAAIGRQPGDYSPKLRIQLDPSMRSDDALKAIHRQLLNTMQQTRQGVIDDIDTEFLHNFRIAVRRTRAALTQMKDIYPPDVVDYFREEFAWLGSITGPTRDLDVYQLTMPSYRAKLPPEARGHLDPLEGFLAEHQRVEQAKLGRELATQRYRDLVASWGQFLNDPVPPETPLAAAKRSVNEVGSKRIWKAYRRVIKKGKAIGSETPAEQLHELRIEAKKLRYLLEFFRSLYDPEAMQRLIQELKWLQDNLGDFNDLEVQQTKLKEFGNAMLAEGDAPFETYMTMGRLLEVLEAAQEHERQAFHDRFDRFASEKNRRLFQRLFRSVLARA